MRFLETAIVTKNIFMASAWILTRRVKKMTTMMVKMKLICLESNDKKLPFKPTGITGLLIFQKRFRFPFEEYSIKSDIFFSVFNNEVFKLLVRETNLYAEQEIKKLRRNERLRPH